MTLTGPERKELERRVASRRGRADDARRARCVLLATEGASWTTIRAQLGCSDSYVARWTGRFARERLAGLYSRHRGQPATTLTPRVEAYSTSQILPSSRKIIIPSRNPTHLCRLESPSVLPDQGMERLPQVTQSKLSDKRMNNT
jgi:hypothetical protein